MSGRDKKEFKLGIHKDRDPEIFKWATTLNYGLFPKLIVEMLRWYEKNGLLVKGGVASPDLLISLNQNPPILEGASFEKQVLEKLDHLEVLLKSTDLRNIEIDTLQKLAADQSKTQSDLNELSSSSSIDHVLDQKANSVTPIQDLDGNGSEDEQPIMLSMPMQSNFKVYKYEKKED